MIAPRTQLLICVALLLPLAGVAAAVPAAESVSLALLLLAAALVVIDAIVSTRSLHGIEVRIPELVRLTKNKDGVIPLHIVNTGQKTARIRIGLPFPREIESEQQTMDVAFPAGAELSLVSWPCLPQKRGRYFLARTYFETRSPLGFWNARSSTKLSTELRVYPNLLEERKKLAAVFLHRGNIGIHSQRMVGQGRDFEKLREYVRGDGMDQIHWKATAKRGKPVTKVFQIERTQEVYVCIDFSRLTAQEFGGQSILERYLTAALVLGLVAQQQGDLFGLLTFSDRVHRFLRARSGKTHYAACRDAIYTLQPNIVTPDFNDLCSYIRLRLRRRALLVMLTDLSDPVLAESFLQDTQLIARQHLILVNMIKPAAAHPMFALPDATKADDLYHRLSGHLFWENLAQLQNSLRSYGITLSQLENERLTAEVVTQYLNVKQRQIL